MVRTYIVKFATSADDYKEHLDNHLNGLCKDTNGAIEIFELNAEGTKEAEKIIQQKLGDGSNDR